MTTTEPTPEAVEELARAVHVLMFPRHADCDPKAYELEEADLYLRAALAAGYVKLEDFEPDLGKRQHPAVLRLRGVRAERTALEAKVARVEALAAEWERDEGRTWVSSCGDDLREALNPESSSDECIDDTDLCEHGLRFGCEACSPPPAFLRPTPGGGL